MRRLILYLAGLCLGLSAPMQGPALRLGAAARPSSHAHGHKPVLPQHVLNVPIVRQEEDYSCGPAALRAILQYYGLFSGREQQLYKLLDTSTEQGTLPENIALGARRFGLSATIEQWMTIDRLRSLNSAGKLVILELQAWRDDDRPTSPWRDTWDDGHYVVLIGLDAEFAYFMDPSTGDAYTYLPLGELLERWHDYNPIRKDPREHRDIQLGVVISGAGRPGHRFPARPSTRRVTRLD
jgi:predicted double-glycine peptidase